MVWPVPDPHSNELVPGKETVVRRRGADWSFQLPREHTLRVEGELVFLRTPQAGSIFKLIGTEERGDEVIVRLGGALRHLGPDGAGERVVAETGYPLPELEAEVARLGARWEEAGLSVPYFNAWPAGPPNERHLAELRRRLREQMQPHGIRAHDNGRA